VTPPEDLMREHGVLDRGLLTYEATLRNLSGNENFDPSAVSGSAQIVRQLSERYHERREELHVFPRFRAAGQLVGLVDVLYQQHQAGRRLTDMILGLAPGSAKPGDERHRLMQVLQSLIRMYRPHEAREDTELFPKLREIVSANEFDAMAEDFERDEQQKFGEYGFATMVDRVAHLEQVAGINDLAQVRRSEPGPSHPFWEFIARRADPPCRPLDFQVLSTSSACSMVRPSA
jgi:hemerythrin-like domain-containing protein